MGAMRKIFIYYSLSGNGDFVAAELRSRGYEILKLEPSRPLKKRGFAQMFWLGLLASLRVRRKLKAYDFDAANYHKILIGSPIWADRLSTPINTFLKRNPLRERAPLFLLYSGGGYCKQAKKDIAKICPSAFYLDLEEPLKKPDKTKTTLDLIA